MIAIVLIALIISFVRLVFPKNRTKRRFWTMFATTFTIMMMLVLFISILFVSVPL